MADNDELILGLCPLPELQESVPESNGANTSSPPPAQFDGEMITGDLDEINHVGEQSKSNESIEGKPIIDQSQAHIDEFNHVEEQNDSENADNAEELADNPSEPVKVSANLVDFINQAGAELMAGTTLEDDDSDNQPAKKRRKVLPKGNAVKGTYQCAECRLVCEDFNVYAAHMNTHSEIPLFTCMKCLYIFQDKSLYDAHTAQLCRAAGNAKDKECAVCRKTFKYDSHLREHIICMHNKTPMFICPICGQNITSWRRSIDRHMANHANNIKCPTCGVKGENIEAVDAHIAENGENHLQCKTCEFTTNSRAEFFSHINVHIPKVDVLEPMVCYKCSHRFQRTSEYNNHIRLFCKFREVQASDLEAVKASEPVPPTIQIPMPDVINSIQGGNAGIFELAGDPSKQMITLPEGVNNNTFIPITVTTGNDQDGTTVILIPQILLMPNAGGLSHEGAAEIFGGGQNDQVIYLECLKPEQQGMLPMFELPGVKSTQEAIFPNHLPQTVVQTIQSVQEAETLPAVQTLQTVQPVQTTQPAQSIQQSVLPIQTIHPMQAAHLNEPRTVEVIKTEMKEEAVEKEEVPVPPMATSVAVSTAAQSAQSVASSATQNMSTIDSVIQQVIDQSCPPALVCSFCHEVLRDTETYETHMKQHDKVKAKPPKPHIVVQKKGSAAFNCDQCGQGFAAKHHLEQHTITFHSDVAGIVCPVCRAGMASEKTSLNEHLAKAHKLRVEPSGKLTECTES